MPKLEVIPYGRQSIDEKDIRVVIDVLRSDWLTQGPKIKEFESALCQYTGAKYAVVVSNGTAALHLACLAAGIGKGDRVITSPITFAASANSILYAGGTPVFIDVDQEIVNISPEKIQHYIEHTNIKLNNKLKAIIPVHFAGYPCEMEKIYQIAKKYNLIIIEDAAHALGAKYKINELTGSLVKEFNKKNKEKWIKIGSCQHSNMTIFSFHPVKSITTGEGGAVLTNNKELYEKLLMLRNHGITRNHKKFVNPLMRKSVNPLWYYEMQMLGFNYRITDIQAALGISQLKKLDTFITKRHHIAQVYDKAFRCNPYFTIPTEREYLYSAYHLYQIRLNDKLMIQKTNIFRELIKQGIRTQVHYIPVYLHPYYQQRNFKKGLCLQAEDFYKREISLPIYPTLNIKQTKYIINNLLSICKKYNG
ncbi:MAG: UDP-4-amino-4,6-dideoxy-N-acetyl-beta-L-altrosamine transaminase [Candidatus Omnitrophota bacterium]